MKQNSLHCQPKLFRIRLSQNSSKWPQICIVSYPCKNGQFHDSCQKSTIPIPLLLRLRQGHSTLLLPELLLALLFFGHQTAVARKKCSSGPYFRNSGGIGSCGGFGKFFDFGRSWRVLGLESFATFLEVLPEQQ